MRFFLLIFSLGIFLAYQAVGATDISSLSLELCKNRGHERRNARLVSRGRAQICIPKTPRSRTSSSISSSARSGSSFSASSSLKAISTDPLFDTTIRSQFLLLGEVGPVMGAASVFLSEEPLDVRTIKITLTAAVPTVQSFLVYNQDKHLLGRANLDASIAGGATFRLTLAPGTQEVPRRTLSKLYARPSLLSKDLGGLGNQTAQISSIGVEGAGVWSSHTYTQAATSLAFQPFLTARSVITKVTNAGEQNGALLTGSNQRLGSFRFEGRKADSLAKIEVTALSFQIESTGGASVANVQLSADGTSDRFNCTVASTTVVCSTIPDTFGSLTDGPRTLTLYGDVTATDTAHASLRMTLNAPGAASVAGSVTWTDGSSAFSWVPVDSPVASGTYYKY